MPTETINDTPAAEDLDFTSDEVKTALQAEGDLPDTCTLPSYLILACGMRYEDPCSGCNHDRAICQGRPKGRRMAPNRLIALVRLAGCGSPIP